MQPGLLVLLVIALLLTSGASSDDLADGEEERLIGWQGEKFGVSQDQDQQQEVAGSGGPQDARRQWIETISWQPRAFIYHNFLTEEECDHLVELGSKRVSRSLVIDSKTGGSKLDDIRTSYGGAFGRGEDIIVSEIEERIAEWTHLPPDYGEPIQILRYTDGQQYAAHWDYFLDEVHEKRADQDGNRYATVLLYLSEVEEGGETTLPLAEPLDATEQALPSASPCATRMGLAVKPRKGDALLFFDMDVEGRKQDRRSLHASCPTLRGTKWTATKWIHNKQCHGKFDPLERAAVCKDTAWDCASKAAQGLCDTDPSLTGLSGSCRLTCKDCIRCPEGDVLCYRRNMRSQRGAARAAAAVKNGGQPAG